MSKPANYDIHVWETRTGKWRARCTALGFTACTAEVESEAFACLLATQIWRYEYHLEHNNAQAAQTIDPAR